MRGIAGNVSVSWTSRLDHAARWIDQHPDLAALVVEAQTDRTSWRSVLAHVRGLASRPLVVVIKPEAAGPRVESLELEADEFLTRNQSLFRDLPIVVRRALDRARAHRQSGQAVSAGESGRRPGATPERLVQAAAPVVTASAEPSFRRHEQLQPERAAVEEGQARLRALVELERAARADIEQKLAHATAALQEAEERH
ncbi:MAG: hypothetical protein ACM3SQ_01605, partial [Betaproteobacteria bacterium]